MDKHGMAHKGRARNAGGGFALTGKDRIASKVSQWSLPLFGLGIMQAWLACMMSLSAIAGDFLYNKTHLIADMSAAVPYIAVLLLAKKVTPLLAKRGILAFGMVLALVANLVIAVAAFVPLPIPHVATLGLALAGAASAIVFLAWWELYAELNPKEVALYYAGSWVLRELVLLALSGYIPLYFVAATFVLLVVAALLLRRGKQSVFNAQHALETEYRSIAFPWKPMLLIALYSFAYGCGTWIASYTDDIFMHLGIMIPALVVCASVLTPYRRFDFSLVYRIILPTAIASLLVLLAVPHVDPTVATLFVQASFTAVLVYSSIVLCNLSRRHHVSASWLFSLFNIVHIACLGMGTMLYSALPSLIIFASCIVCVLLVTFIIVSEPALSSDWNIVLAKEGGGLNAEMRHEISIDALTKQHGLSQREKEVLTLLAAGDLPRSIGAKLHIAPGTAKAHIQHIYAKIGIHSKDELLELLNR